MLVNLLFVSETITYFIVLIICQEQEHLFMYYLSGTRTLIYVLFVRNKNINLCIICQEQEH